MKDLWQSLKEDRLPKLLYGMGNGADKILDVCQKKEIEISGVFASDGFARENLFHGMKVTDYQKAVERFGTFTVLVSFATSRPEVLENILRISREQRLFVPDVPVAGQMLFDGEFFETHRKEFEAARSLLEDRQSKELFDLIIQSKLHGSLPALLQGTSTMEEDYRFPLHPENYRICGDFGAYSGDTAKELVAVCPNVFEILSVEPDPKTFKRLHKSTADLPVTAVHAAAWNREEELFFSVAGNRGSGLTACAHGVPGTKTVSVRGMPLDCLFEEKRADYLKFDVEGAEHQALEGLEKTILRDHPELLVSCYHRPEDLFALPLYLREHFPFYRLYLRRHAGVPAWDINLYAVN